MPKVVTSQNLEEFVRTGAVTHIEPHKGAAKASASPEHVPAAQPADSPVSVVAAVPAPVPDPNASAEELKIAEEFGKQQYTRATLAEQRAADLEREKSAQKTPAQPLKPADDPNAPRIAQFTDSNGVVDWDRLTTAKSEYASQKAVQQERARVAQEAHDAAFRTRLADAQTRYPDFLQVLEKADVMIHDDVLAHLSDSPVGADITYYLAKHSDEAERIRALHPRQALAEIGKLEERAPWTKGTKPTAGATPPAETQKEPKQSRTAPAESSPSTRRAREAPAPISALPPSAGAGNAPVDPSKMDYRQLREYERNRARNRGARR